MSMATRILIGLLAGILTGVALTALAPESTTATVVGAVQPVGRLWLNALQMTVVPLVVSLLVVGVATAADAAATGRIARRTLGVIVLLLALGGVVGALASPLAFGIVPAEGERMEALRASLDQAEPPTTPDSIGEWITGLVPTNAIAAAASGSILPVVVFALFFGFALTRISEERRLALLNLFRGISDTMMVIVGWILWAAPVGVFALLVPVAAGSGLALLGALGYYVVVSVVLVLLATALLYAVCSAFARVTPWRFARAMFPVQTVALSTQSSLASLPAMVEASTQRLGLPERTAGIVLPLAVSLCRFTSPLKYMVAAAFIAWLYGVHIPPLLWIGGVALGVVISLGAVGLPGQVSFMGTYLPVMQAMGLPWEPLVLLLAVDTIPDMFGTLGNVTADVTVAAIVAASGESTAGTSAGEAAPAA